MQFIYRTFIWKDLFFCRLQNLVQVPQWNVCTFANSVNILFNQPNSPKCTNHRQLLNHHIKCIINPYFTSWHMRYHTKCWVQEQRNNSIWQWFRASFSFKKTTKLIHKQYNKYNKTEENTKTLCSLLKSALSLFKCTNKLC